MYCWWGISVVRELTTVVKYSVVPNPSPIRVRTSYQMYNFNLVAAPRCHHCFVVITSLWRCQD